MLTIRTTTGQIFDLFPDTKLSIEENSPLFSDAGSFSLPLELPATDNNLQILDYPHRPDRRKRFATHVDVVISCGVWIKNARMDLESSGRKKNITASLFFGESPFYAKIKNKELKDLFKDKIRDDYANQTQEHKHTFWRNYLDKVMCGDVNDDFYIFPVCATIEEKEESSDSADISVKTTWTRYLILNRQSVPTATNSGETKQSLSGKTYYSLVGVNEAYTDEGIQYFLPDGYGKCPFLKFTFVLRYAIEKLGYTLSSSIFDTDATFQKLCFVHNTVDCLVHGYIDYSQIVPDIGFSDFLKTIENMFGCRFIINEADKSVTPRFWKDIVNELPEKDITRNFIDYPQITYNEPKSLKLTVKRSVPESQPTAFETYPQLFAKYGRFRGSFKNKMLLQIELNRGDLDEGVYLLQNNRVNAVAFKHYPNFIDDPTNFSWVVIEIERDTLDYYNPESPVFDEKALNIETVVLKPVAMRGETDKRFEVTMSKAMKVLPMAQLIEKTFSKFTPNDGIIAQIPYIGSVRHLNTALETTSTKDDVSTSSIKEENESSLPIFLCQSHGFAAADPDMQNIDKTFFAAPDAYDNMGNKLGTFDLTTRSLYDNFSKEYDALISVSFHEISGNAQIDIAEFKNLSFDKIYTYEGQKSLISSIRYELSAHGANVVDFKVKTIKSYE